MSPPSLGTFLGGRHAAPDGTPFLAGHFEGDGILVPLLASDPSIVADQIEIASALARASGASLTVIDPISVPEGTPTEVGDGVADDDALIARALEERAGSTARLDGDRLHTRDAVTGVLRTVRTRDAGTLVLPSGSGRGRLRKGAIERIAAHAACDVLVVNGRAGYETAASILLPIAGGPHSGLAADVARSIAADCDAWIDVLHVLEEDASGRERERAEELVADASRRISRPDTTSTWVLEADDVAGALIEQSRYYGLTILGAPTKGRLRRFIHGSTNRSVRRDARSVVLSARNNGRVAPDGD